METRKHRCKEMEFRFKRGTDYDSTVNTPSDVLTCHDPNMQMQTTTTCLSGSPYLPAGTIRNNERKDSISIQGTKDRRGK